MSYLTAKDIAKESSKLNKSFSQVMNLAIDLAEEKDQLQVMIDSLKHDRQQLKDIIFLLECWERGRLNYYDTYIATADGTGQPSDFDIIRHIKDEILTEKGDV